MPSPYYFSVLEGSNSSGLGTEASPWGMFKGMKDGVQALSGGETCLFQRNNIWLASSAELICASSGTPAEPIIFGAYGTGNIPIFAGAAITSNGWVATGVSSIYMLTGQNQTHLMVVTQQDTMGLCLWFGTTSNLAEGTYIRSGSNLYVHLWGNSDPSVASVRVPSFAHSSSADGARGLVSTARTNSSRGAYVQFNSMMVLCANGVGMSASAMSNQFFDCQVLGAGKDGVLFYGELTGSNELAIGGRWWRGDVSYGAARGSGNGQGWTSYAPGTWCINAEIHDNFMAGVDFLDFGVGSNVTQVGVVWCKVYRNGRWQDSTSSDPQIYFDGASEWIAYGNEVWGASYQGIEDIESGIAFGSEHPDTKPCENGWIINNLMYMNDWVCWNSKNTGTSNNIKNITIVNNTAVAAQTGGFEMVFFVDQHDTTAGNWIMRNNIWYAMSASCNDFMDDISDWIDSDFNLFYRRAGNTNIYKVSGTNNTLAQWQAATGEDASSVYGDPLFVNASEGTIDVHLKASSPAIGLGTANAFDTAIPWLPADIFIYGCGVRGIARSDGTVDLLGTDAGYHYNSQDSFGTTNQTGVSLSRNIKLTIQRNSKITLAAV